MPRQGITGAEIQSLLSTLVMLVGRTGSREGYGLSSRYDLYPSGYAWVDTDVLRNQESVQSCLTLALAAQIVQSTYAVSTGRNVLSANSSWILHHHRNLMPYWSCPGHFPKYFRSYSSILIGLQYLRWSWRTEKGTLWEFMIPTAMYLFQRNLKDNIENLKPKSPILPQVHTKRHYSIVEYSQF